MTNSSVSARLIPRYFRVRADELEAIKAKARELGISDAEVVRLAVRAYLALDQR